jgi:predicted nucleic acid-binding protein
MKPICLDSSAWIEIAEDGPNAKAFAKALSSQPLIVSSINLYEIAKYITREAGESDSQELVAFIKQYDIIDVSETIALSASELSVRCKLAMADSLIYATTLAHKATLWTQDADFKGLPHVKYFPKIKS